MANLLNSWDCIFGIDFYVMVVWLTEFLGRCNLIFQECLHQQKLGSVNRQVADNKKGG